MQRVITNCGTKLGGFTVKVVSSSMDYLTTFNRRYLLWGKGIAAQNEEKSGEGLLASFVPRKRRSKKHTQKPQAIKGLLALAFIVVSGSLTHAQSWATMAWKPLFHSHGLKIDYIFYPLANGQHDGIVIKLTNQNAYSVTYQFTIVFRSDSTEVEYLAQGNVPAHRMITGDRYGLFWIPFRDGQRIREIGLRRWKINAIK